MMKRLIALLLALAMVLGLAACGGAAQEPAKEEAPAAEAPAAEAPAAEAPAAEAGPKTLYVNQGPAEFFEYPWWNAGCYTYQKILFETLIGMDANGDATTADGMTESYELSEDGLSLKVTLRDGLMWHDGQPVTAEDVVWSAETIAEGSILTLGTVSACMKKMASVEAVSDKEILFTLNEVEPNILLAMALFHILPKHCLENADVTQFQQDPFWQNPIGSGPFKLESVVMGEYANFVPNENYWNGVADFNIYCSVSAADSDPNLVVNAKAGKIDYAYTKSYADVQALQEVDGITITPVSVLYTRLLRFNLFPHAAGETSMFNDVRVRQAFAYAIDRATICAQVFGGASDPGDGTPTPTGHAWKTEGLEPYAYDMAKAKELLDEAGFDYNQTVEIAYYYTDQATIDLMAIIQQMLAMVGVKAEPKLYEGDLNTILNGMPTDRHLDKGVSTVNWDIVYAGFAPSNPHEYYTYFHGETGSRNFFPIDDTVTEYIDEMVATTDVAVQKAAYDKLERYWNENMWEIPLYYQPVWVVTSEKVAGNVDTWGNPQFGWDWDIQNWTLN